MGNRSIQIVAASLPGTVIVAIIIVFVIATEGRFVLQRMICTNVNDKYSICNSSSWTDQPVATRDVKCSTTKPCLQPKDKVGDSAPHTHLRRRRRRRRRRHQSQQHHCFFALGLFRHLPRLWRVCFVCEWKGVHITHRGMMAPNPHIITARLSKPNITWQQNLSIAMAIHAYLPFLVHSARLKQPTLETPRDNFFLYIIF